MSDLVVEIAGDARIVVPNTTASLSTYVLLEQEDWFEKEIAFVRRVLGPGMRALDVGANFGVYTAAIAQRVGPAGRVWAVEPASETYARLGAMIDLNGFRQVRALRVALSDHEGTGRLGTSDHAELNSLSAEASPTSETVALATLDSLAVAEKIDGIDFIKLDAEGEELRIVGAGAGGAFLRRESPLIMFEVKAGTTLDLSVARALEALGYTTYRLVGPDRYLIPVASGESLDSFELNLFACKAERAASLAARGLLVQSPDPSTTMTDGAGLALWVVQPFAPGLGADPRHASREYLAAMDAYAASRDESASPAKRLAALHIAAASLESLAGKAPAPEVLSLLARACVALGRRADAVRILAILMRELGSGQPLSGAPCWPAHPRFERIAARTDPREWLLASAVEAYLEASAFSGFYTRDPQLGLCDWLQSTSYASAPLERRRQLMAIAQGRQRAIVASPLLALRTDSHRNVGFWTGATAPTA